MVVAGFGFKWLLEILISLGQWITQVMGVWWDGEGRYPGYVTRDYP